MQKGHKTGITDGDVRTMERNSLILQR